MSGINTVAEFWSENNLKENNQTDISYNLHHYNDELLQILEK